jgi:hypothetical protein
VVRGTPRISRMLNDGTEHWSLYGKWSPRAADDDFTVGPGTWEGGFERDTAIVTGAKGSSPIKGARQRCLILKRRGSLTGWPGAVCMFPGEDNDVADDDTDIDTDTDYDDALILSINI